MQAVENELKSHGTFIYVSIGLTLLPLTKTSSAFYIERIGEGKVFCDANQQPFSSITLSFFAIETS